jgi:hypothetical protein
LWERGRKTSAAVSLGEFVFLVHNNKRITEATVAELVADRNNPVLLVGYLLNSGFTSVIAFISAVVSLAFGLTLIFSPSPDRSDLILPANFFGPYLLVLAVIYAWFAVVASVALTCYAKRYLGPRERKVMREMLAKEQEAETAKKQNEDGRREDD